MTTGERLIEAAVDHLNRSGLEGLSLRSVARAIGVSHAAPARHFEGVSTLLSAVAAQSFRGLTETIEHSVGRAGESPLAQLTAAGEAYVEFALAHPAEYELMFRPERLNRSDAGYLEASLTAFNRIDQLVSAAQETGWRHEADHLLLTGVVWSGVHGVASLLIQGALVNATSISDPDSFVRAMICSLINSDKSTS